MSVEASHPFPGVVLERELQPEGSAEIFTVAWAPDGRMLATGGKDGVVRIWRSDGQRVAALPGHDRTVLSVAFSPTGGLLASGSADRSVRIWDLDTLTCTRKFTGQSLRVTSVAWSGDGEWLVSGSDDGTVRCGLPRHWDRLELLVRHENLVNSVAVSATGNATACASADCTVRLWHTEVRPEAAWPIRELLLSHPAAVDSVGFAPDGRFVATGCHDAAIRIWDVGTGSMVRLLEGHSTAVRAVAFSPDGRFLVSKSDGGTVRLWRCDRWSQLGQFFEDTTSHLVSIGISRDNVLATFGAGQRTVALWRLDPELLLAGAERRSQYCNAKVVLVGDSGVGKSGLALALAGKPFVATESTHARNIWRLDERVVELTPDLEETREIVLWDLAGQPAYRIVHQLHLHDTTIAILVLDARSETDPLAGVRHWDRALRQARRVLASQAPLRKVLVVARIDRGGVALGPARLAQLREELEVAEQDYFETSAKQGWGIAELRDAVDRGIDWDQLPKVTSTRLFHDIRSFVIAAREQARRLVTVPVLCDAFLAGQPGRPPAEVRSQFATCIGRLESSGVVRGFAFGNYVLLEPELLDAYASAIVGAARDEPDGLGIIAEDCVRAGQFRIPADRLADPREEELLLIATIEALVRGEIALRESTDDGVVLLFPAQSTREPPPGVAELRPSYRVVFEGSARSVYATLAVRLTRSGVFQRDEIWRDGLTVKDSLAARCGVRLHEVTEVGGTLEVVISSQTAPVIRAQLEQFVHAHVARRAVAATVRAEVVVVCGGCGVVFPPEHVQKRLDNHKTWIICQVCDHRTELAGLVEQRAIPDGATAMPENVTMMNRDADSHRDSDAASVRLAGKATARDFDVFLCHHAADKREVKRIGEQLRARGYLPWLDEWELPPGQPWLRELEAQIESIRAAAVFIGADGTGPWQSLELSALLRQFIERGCPVIPVVLPSVSIPRPRLPAFLHDFTWVDFRVDEPAPVDRLIWGITRVKPASGPGASTTYP
ncbi:MAG TPA: TIR domain-containing protein [Kofleriaceae bacterium]|nr:TIR domain-containing protein [Kofleriaceae bacterium]